MAFNDASPEDDDGVGRIETTGAATEDKLGTLHGIVAEYLSLKLATGKATAAEVGAAITFLKNNSITADPATNAALANLKGTLANRKRRGGLTPQEANQATAQFDSMLGGMGLGNMQ